MKRAMLGFAVSLVAIAAAAAPCRARTGSDGRYDFAGNVELGAPNFFDYVTYDPAGKRLYAAHVDRLSVLDVARGMKVGDVAPIDGAHGSVILPRAGKGYVASGEDGVLKVFNLSDLSITKEIKLAPDADGAIFDPKTGMILVVSGDAKTLFVVDPATDTVKRQVALPDQPEYLAVDGRGNVFINLTTTAQVAKVDIAHGRVLATFKLPGCERPHGLAYDPALHRLFSGCTNKRMVVLDATNGASLASVEIGPQSDGLVWDAKRDLAIASNANGTMSVVIAKGKSNYAVRTIPTFFGGRNIDIDPETGMLFVAHGHMKVMSSLRDLANLRFGWDGLDVAMFKPQP